METTQTLLLILGFLTGLLVGLLAALAIARTPLKNSKRLYETKD